jgi:hypothetical protein
MSKVSTYIFALILYLLHYQTGIVQHAVGAEVEDEPYISLRAKNQPLGGVLSRLSLDTGIEISLDDKWRSYPINDTIENVPLHKGLKLILRGLNHAIIYESPTKIRIVVYDEADSQSSNTIYTPPISPPAHYNEPPPPAETPVEGTDETGSMEDSSEETESKNTAEEERDDDEASSEDSLDKKGEQNEEATAAEGVKETEKD